MADARKLDHKTLTALRNRAVSSIQKGTSPEKVAKIFKVHRVTVYGWLARYQKGGPSALNASKRGGRPKKLDDKTLKWIFNTVSTKSPLQLKFPFSLWTSKIIGQLIYRKFGIKLSKASVCRLLNQLGLTPQKPVGKAYQQKTDEVKRWLKKEYPAIRSLAKKLKADVYFEDEACVRSDFYSGTTRAVKGQTPQVTSSGARFGLNMISTVNAQGKFRFMIVKGEVEGKTFIDFLKRLMQGSKKKIFLIVDQQPAHSTDAVTQFLETEKNKIRLFFLPPYSPENHPAEVAFNGMNDTMGDKTINSSKNLQDGMGKCL